MKRTLIAVSLLAAIVGWMFVPPPKTVASQTEIKTEEVTSPSNEQNNEVVAPVSVSLETRNSGAVPIRKNHVSSTSAYNGRHYSKEEVQQLIRDYSAQYGISADLPLRVASCESGFNQLSRNKSSTASGIYQYLSSTWIHTELGRQGVSVLDADANVHMAIKSIASGGISSWNASRSCWSK